ncbi:type II toxin-antitoxin system VapC family toxin [Actinopolymorpha alba]|uniref:type II toxin-antitoxin system VapC family toxin n=1 Tax=Actinopolymorpha alba TaxID=533267 RepID=UPI00037EEC1D|nr:type II toxin-antitoxin system VapC family toxin [Actinopolymorpha alba]
MIVVDASVLTEALTGDGPGGVNSRTELARDSQWVAPEHLIAETFNAIRGRHRCGKLDEERAHWALDALRSLTIELLRVQPFLTRMWSLRDSLSGYDAAYVAVAEHFDAPLVTCDARLARAANRLKCGVRPVWPAT